VTTWYALVDTAQDRLLHPLVQSCAKAECLFSGNPDPVLAAASPHLVRLDDGSPLMAAWAERGGGRNWGILCESQVEFASLRRHFKKFLNARLPDGTIALFRFYDPRVFDTYIRACTPEERAPWFNGVLQYSVEGEGGIVHNFRMRQGRLCDGEAEVAR
jgi:Domain of unknown function (DUF4123)